MPIYLYERKGDKPIILLLIQSKGIEFESHSRNWTCFGRILSAL